MTNQEYLYQTVEECYPEADLVSRVAHKMSIGRALVSSSIDEDPRPNAYEYEGAYQYVIASIVALSFLEPGEMETVIMSL